MPGRRMWGVCTGTLRANSQGTVRERVGRPGRGVASMLHAAPPTATTAYTGGGRPRPPIRVWQMLLATS